MRGMGVGRRGIGGDRRAERLSVLRIHHKVKYKLVVACEESLLIGHSP